MRRGIARMAIHSGTCPPVTWSSFATLNAGSVGGDVLFRGSVGRTDLPGCNPEELVSSIENQLFSLPDDYTIWPGQRSFYNRGRRKIEQPFCQWSWHRNDAALNVVSAFAGCEFSLGTSWMSSLQPLIFSRKSATFSLFLERLESMRSISRSRVPAVAVFPAAVFGG